MRCFVLAAISEVFPAFLMRYLARSVSLASYGNSIDD